MDIAPAPTSFQTPIVDIKKWIFLLYGWTVSETSPFECIKHFFQSVGICYDKGSRPKRNGERQGQRKAYRQAANHEGQHSRGFLSPLPCLAEGKPERVRIREGLRFEPHDDL